MTSDMELVWVQNVKAMIKESRMFSDGMRERCLARFDKMLTALATEAKCVEYAENDFFKACARAEKAERLSKEIAEKAREYAAHYPEASDGRNTFIIFADWIDTRRDDEAWPSLEREHQDFRLQNDREWKAKVDWQNIRAEKAERKLSEALNALKPFATVPYSGSNAFNRAALSDEDFRAARQLFDAALNEEVSE